MPQGKKKKDAKKVDLSTQLRLGKLSAPKHAFLQHVPTKSVFLNHLFGIPGIILGRILEIAGPFGSCKSTLCVLMMKAFQEFGGAVVLADTENAYTSDWVHHHGVNPDDVFTVDARCLEAMFEGTRQTIKSVKKYSVDTPVLIVIDAASALPTYAESMSTPEDIGSGTTKGAHARIMSQYNRILVYELWDSRASLIYVSHLKDNPMDPYKRFKIGGHAIDFHSAIQIVTTKAGTAQQTGIQTIHARTVKNKVCPPLRQVVFDFNPHTQSIDDSACVLNLATERGLVAARGGGWYTITGESTNIRRVDAADRLREMILKAQQEEFVAKSQVVEYNTDRGNEQCPTPIQSQGAIPIVQLPQSQPPLSAVVSPLPTESLPPTETPPPSLQLETISLEVVPTAPQEETDLVPELNKSETPPSDSSASSVETSTPPPSS